MQHNNTDTNLLKDIHLPPSEKTIADRFTQAKDAKCGSCDGNCDGNCESTGGCKGNGGFINWCCSEKPAGSVHAATAYLDNLDLDYIVESMCSPSYPLPRWTETDAKLCAQLYKNFLLLHKKHPEVNLVPTQEIDEFWHNHILYTKKYQHDCMHLFGHYFHHEPAKPDEDPAKMVANYKKTKALYQEVFQQPLDLIKG